MLPQVPQDKANHFIYGVAIGVVAQFLCSFNSPNFAPLAATLAALVAGAAKEGLDYWKNKRAAKDGSADPYEVSYGDGIATFLGGVVCGIVAIIQEVGNG